MVQYEYLVREALDKLKDYAANLRKKLAAGAPAGEFFRNLGGRTDAAIRDYLVNTLGIANPWPA